MLRSSGWVIWDFCWHLDSKKFLVDKKYKSHQKFEVFFIVTEECHILSEQKLLKPLVIWSESVCSKHVAYSIASTHSPQIAFAFPGGNALASLMQLEQILLCSVCLVQEPACGLAGMEFGGLWQGSKQCSPHWMQIEPWEKKVSSPSSSSCLG